MTDVTRQADAADRLTRWVGLYAQRLFGFLSAQVHDRHQAEDLLQEVFCRAWEAQERYTDVGFERAYLWRIADRLARDRLRRQRRETPVDERRWEQIEPADDTQSPPMETLLQLEHHQKLEAALNALSEMQRRTLLLRYYGQLEFHEIATILDCPLNTALSHAHRGLAVLRRRMVEAPYE